MPKSKSNGKQTVYSELSTVVKCTPLADETREAFLTRLLAAVNTLEDADFDKLSEPSRNWFNAAGKALNDKKPEDMPDPEGLPSVPFQLEPSSPPPASKKGKEKTAMPKTPTVKQAAKKAPVKASTERRGRAPEHADGDAIRLLVKENPKRKSSAAYKRFELYRKHSTVAAFLKAGGDRTDLRYDTEHKYIAISSK